MSLSTQVMQDIAVERDTQDRQWGGASHDDTHVMADWHQYINYQSDKLLFEAIFPEPDLMECRDRLVKIAALAIAAIDSIDRSL
jgi:hypothetical protein